MPLEIRPTSRFWYGRIEVGGKRRLVPLRIPIDGARPACLRAQGDERFEISRAKAQAKLAQIEQESRELNSSAKLLERIHTIRTGTKTTTVLLKDMFSSYRTQPGVRFKSERYARQAEAIAKDFTDFATLERPPVLEMGLVTTDLAERYAENEKASGRSGKTFDNRIGLLRTFFRKLKRKAGLFENPFGEIPKEGSTDDTVFRKPFTIDEITRVLAAVQDNDFIRPIVVVALTTAMRRINVCLLQYAAVDWPNQLIRVKPAKGGMPVGIPIFPLLAKELAPRMQLPEARKLSGYVFPDQAKMFQTNPDGISLRVQQALVRAGFAPTGDDGDASAISVRRRKGCRRASIYGMHSFRTTWITLALMAGIPIPLIQRVTGQRSVDVILKHYFHPQDEQLRSVFAEKLPALLLGTERTESQPVPIRLLTLLESMDEQSWQTKREQALALVRELRRGKETPVLPAPSA
jgi:integrase